MGASSSSASSSSSAGVGATHNNPNHLEHTAHSNAAPHKLSAATTKPSHGKNDNAQHHQHPNSNPNTHEEDARTTPLDMSLEESPEETARRKKRRESEARPTVDIVADGCGNFCMMLGS